MPLPIPRTTRWLAWPLMAAMAAWVSGGCAPAQPKPRPAAHAEHDDDHDHDHDHDHDDEAERSKPDTLEAGLAELAKVVAAVKKSLAEKDLDDADGHVHMVGHLVDDLHGLVKRAQLPAEAEAAAKKALDDVFECFDDLDTKLHSADEDVRKAIDFAEHEPRVEAALQALRDIGKPGKPTEPAAAKDIDE